MGLKTIKMEWDIWQKSSLGIILPLYNVSEHYT